MRERFVCARITRMNGVNLNRFEFDYETTWTAFFTDADLNIYSRYGGRDDGDPERRLTKKSFLHTMQEVLDARTEKAPTFQPVPKETRTADEIPLLQKNHSGCIHCHQVREYSLLQTYHDGKFRRADLFPWPLPENVGIEPDLNHGHRAKAIRKNSAADVAGLQAGDVIVAANDIPVRSELDLRWVLQRMDAAAPLRLRVERSSDSGKTETLDVTLKLPAGWKQTKIGWRKSMRSIPFAIGMRCGRLTPTPRRELGLPEEGTLALRVLTVAEKGLAANLKLHKRDVIIAVGGNSPQSNFDQFQSLLLNRYRPGDEVELTILRDGKRMQVKGLFPDWFTDETSIP